MALCTSHAGMGDKTVRVKNKDMVLFMLEASVHVHERGCACGTFHDRSCACRERVDTYAVASYFFFKHINVPWFACVCICFL
jgi:hypothetical protein